MSDRRTVTVYYYMLARTTVGTEDWKNKYDMLIKHYRTLNEDEYNNISYARELYEKYCCKQKEK